MKISLWPEYDYDGLDLPSGTIVEVEYMPSEGDCVSIGGNLHVVTRTYAAPEPAVYLAHQLVIPATPTNERTT